MTRKSTSIAALFAAALLAGCIVSSDDDGTMGHIAFGNDAVTVHARARPDAVVSADGSLRIDGDPVTLTAPQQALLKSYYADALRLRSDGFAVGKAGIAVAGKAVGSAIRGLVSSDPDRIEAEVEADAAHVEAKVAELCGHLAELEATQDAIATSLPVFKPYAAIEARHCGENG
jgi:hypothetical protein